MNDTLPSQDRMSKLVTAFMDGTNEQLRQVSRAVVAQCEQDKTVVMQVRCEDDDCGMFSVYEFWRDGSYKEVMRGCWHSKRWPSKEKIKQAMETERTQQ